MVTHPTDPRPASARGDCALALVWGLHVALVLSAACSSGVDLESSARDPADGPTTAASRTANLASTSLAGLDELPGEELVIDIPEGERVFVSLGSAKGVSGEDASNSLSWDLAFEGWDVYTNSGPSGEGDGAGFGPNDELDFLFDSAPNVPFMRPDRSGGAFLDWYAYDAESHQLWSRYHVYGVRDGDRLWKVQLLGYYGEQLGAPVSALYRVRVAEVTEQGSEDRTEYSDLDATAGYPKVDDSKSSACLSLETGEVTVMTPDSAGESKDWQLCLRRDQVSVNGESGGPGNVQAVDLHSARFDDEVLDDVKRYTSEEAQAAFDAVDYQALTAPGLKYRGDRIVSIFSDAWLEDEGDAVAPVSASWLVRGADGERQYSVVFRSVKANDDGIKQVTLRVREVRENEE